MSNLASGGSDVSTPWVRFQQREDLTVRLRNILEDYAFGPGIFKEFLQNADDARATRLVILVDHTSHSESGLLDQHLAEWQGPSVFVFNDAVFSDEDFEGICSVGASVKRTDFAKIGRYGLGFNTVYHLTDVVSFISRDQFCMFDPHEAYLPDNLPGLRLPGLDDPSQRTRYPGQFEPFESAAKVLGINLWPLSGALFRMPLRSAEQASRSRVCHDSRDAFAMSQLLEELLTDAHELLLFLQSVTSVEGLVRHADGSVQHVGGASLRMGEASLAQRLRHERSLFANFAALEGPAVHRSAMSFMIDTHRPADSDSPHTELQMSTTVWMVVLRCEKVDKKNDDGEDELPPTRCTAVALRLWPPVAEKPFVDGTAFCFLPLAIKTGLAVHCSANFALTANRRDLWRGGGDLAVAGKAAKRAAWNEVLLSRTVPSVLADALTLRVALAQEPGTASKSHKKPKGAAAASTLPPFINFAPPGEPWDRVTKAVSAEELWTLWPSAGEGAFAQVPQATTLELLQRQATVFWDEVREAFVDSKHALLCNEEKYAQLQPVFKNALTRMRTNAQRRGVVKVPQRMCSVFEEVDSVPWLTPQALANEFRSHPPKLVAADADAVAVYLLENSTSTSVLHGLHVAPLANGSVGQFDKPTGVVSDVIWWADDSEMAALMPNARFLASDSECSKILLSNRWASLNLNVRMLNAKVLSDAKVLSYILPPSWSGHSVVKLEMGKDGNNSIMVDGEDAASVRDAFIKRIAAESSSKASKVKKGKAKQQTKRLNMSGDDGYDDWQDFDGWNDESWNENGSWDEDGSTWHRDDGWYEADSDWQQGSDVKGRTNVNRAARSTPEVEECRCETLQDFLAAIHRCGLLWRCVEASAPEKGSVPTVNGAGCVGEYPCIPTVSEDTTRTELISLKEACRRHALAWEDFSAAERQVLVDVGVTFLQTGPRLHRTLNIDKASTLQALKHLFTKRLSGAGQSTGNPRVIGDLKKAALKMEQARPLRHLLRDFISRRRVPVDVKVLETMPLFETSGGRVAVPLGHLQSVVTPSAEWDALLHQEFSDFLVSWDGEAGEFLAELSRERPSAARFLGGFLAPRIGHLDRDCCLRFLEEVAMLGSAPFRKTGVARDLAAVAKACEEARVVVLEDGSRRLASELVDPDDAVVVGNVTGMDTVFPPEAYRTPPILSVLRQVGLQSLSGEETFLKIARMAERVQHASEAGGCLLSHLGDLAKKNLNWKTATFQQLARMRIFPVFAAHDGQTPPENGSNPGGLDVVSLIDSCTLFKNAPVAWTQFAFLDPRIFDRWPKSLFHRFGALKDPVPLETVVANLFEVCRRWKAAPTTEKSLVAQRQDLVVKHLKELEALQKRSRATQTMVHETLASLAFLVLDDGSLVRPSDVFAELHEGAGEPDDENTSQWSLPKCLRPYRRLLLNLSGPASMNKQSKPVVCMDVAPPPETRLGDFILKSLNDPLLADVVFVLTREDGTEALVHGHRFVLAATCEHFYSAFTSGYLEATGRHTKIELPDWVCPRPLLWLLAYLYNGYDPERAAVQSRDIDRVALTANFHNHYAAGADVVAPTSTAMAAKLRTRRGLGYSLGSDSADGDDLCCLLRLADMYDLQHLKVWAEYRLHTMLTPDNLVALSTHAYFCNASQLLRLCVYHMRLLYADLVGTTEWTELETAIQEMVLRGRDSDSAPQETAGTMDNPWTELR